MWGCSRSDPRPVRCPPRPGGRRSTRIEARRWAKLLVRVEPRPDRPAPPEAWNRPFPAWSGRPRRPTSRRLVRSSTMRAERFDLCGRILGEKAGPLELIDVETLLDENTTVIHYLGPRTSTSHSCGPGSAAPPASMWSSSPPASIPGRNRRRRAPSPREGPAPCGDCDCSGGGCGSIPERGLRPPGCGLDGRGPRGDVMRRIRPSRLLELRDLEVADRQAPPSRLTAGLDQNRSGGSGSRSRIASIRLRMGSKTVDDGTTPCIGGWPGTRGSDACQREGPVQGLTVPRRRGPPPRCSESAPGIPRAPMETVSSPRQT